MKKIILIPIAVLVSWSCGQDTKTAENSADEQIEKVEQEEITEESASKPYEAIYFDMDKAEVVKNDPSVDLMTIKETNDFVIVKTTDNGTFVRKHFIKSFSKENGELLSTIETGKETEGVDPMTIKWLSDSTFDLIDYEYKLVESEEGIYEKGSLKDSTVYNYSIAESGQILEK
ncbi:hypothetical protein MATR_34030 [Marivirga tractuosa]|uniref:Uncharacterized protein n=1 Tax=Marivirga tractuosa (strain ATCC 23168 / DSM 4126 / NBRC 15989 / NCIMB 1408 / VKM B-1430 / H-43) TaxID=643867 RepID=E4TRQ2_MARTH|nr:hypothetical protein [Marivirga tractuosa]ADR22751.1 hypothetical protein Ftrac_2773 [Marivirga tractuosa DSM 4126]BDD16578.1 hypothetical protein MATR_34030 [Marivirga tractuosa]